MKLLSTAKSVMQAAMVLAGLALAAPSSAQQQDTRTSYFRYDPGNGLLLREIIEPNDPALCLVKAYDYDGNGNRITTVLRNCGTLAGDTTAKASITGEAGPPACPGTQVDCDARFDTRKSTTSYAAVPPANPVAGQFPTRVTNALGQYEDHEFDPKFGGMTMLKGPNGLITRWAYDEFGRKILETRNAGTTAETTTNWFYDRFDAPPPADYPATTWPGAAVYRVRVKSSGAPSGATYYDGLNRVIRSETQDFDGNLVKTDTEFDSYGRVAKISKPYTNESLRVWTTQSTDILGRVTAVDDPVGNGQIQRTQTTYQGQVTRVTVSNSGSGLGVPGPAISQVKTVIKNSQGQVVQVYQQ